MHIFSSHAKILGEKLFRTREIPQSGSKAEYGEKERKTKGRPKVGDNNGQAMHGARKPPGPTNWIFWGDKGRKGQKKYLLLGLSQKQIFIFFNLISDFLGNKGICNI